MFHVIILYLLSHDMRKKRCLLRYLLTWGLITFHTSSSRLRSTTYLVRFDLLSGYSVEQRDYQHGMNCAALKKAQNTKLLPSVDSRLHESLHLSMLVMLQYCKPYISWPKPCTVFALQEILHWTWLPINKQSNRNLRCLWKCSLYLINSNSSLSISDWGEKKTLKLHDQ